jgi:hypothetical protein
MAHDSRMTEPVLTQRHLNRALLARQLLLERAAMPLDGVAEQTGGIQAQYTPSTYVGLWTRTKDLARASVTAALEDGRLVQGTTLRVTIHAVSRREYWPYVAGVRRFRREWHLRVSARDPGERARLERRLMEAAAALRAALDGGPRHVRELDGLADGFVGHAGLWVDLVRVPPSATWERRRADRLALAEQWIGPCDANEDEGIAHLVRAYLRAFGPAPWRDIATWAGVPPAEVQRAGEALPLARFLDEAGRPMVDLAGAPLPDPTTPAPARFLPHWDAVTLVHARRTGILPEEHRARVYSSRNPFSMGTVLVDGRVVAGWSLADGRVVVEQFEEIARRDRDAVEEERAALERFCA